MNIEGLERVGKRVEVQLKEVRDRIRARLGEWSPLPVTFEISGDKLQKLAHISPGEPIIIRDEFHLAYIKDHSFHSNYDLETQKEPNGCFSKGNKVHFYYCTTLQNMKRKGRQERYNATRKIDNIQTIDLRNAMNTKTRLAWCKHCITLLQKAGEVNRWEMWQHRSRVAISADAGDLIKCVKLCYFNGPFAAQKTRDFFESIK